MPEQRPGSTVHLNPCGTDVSPTLTWSSADSELRCASLPAVRQSSRFLQATMVPSSCEDADVVLLRFVQRDADAGRRCRRSMAPRTQRRVSSRGPDNRSTAAAAASGAERRCNDPWRSGSACCVVKKGKAHTHIGAPEGIPRAAGRSVLTGDEKQDPAVGSFQCASNTPPAAVL